MTRIISITWARNEEDILESFVRHNMQYLEKMVVILHRSTDSSKDILETLRAENFSIDIITADTPYHEQSRFLTQSLHQYASEHVDFFLPIDADEYLMCNKKNIMTSLNELSPHTVYTLPFCTYVPTAQDNDLEPNPVRRITHRRFCEVRPFSRVLAPQALASNGTLSTGGHALLDASGNTIPTIQHPSLRLAHFPIRSEMQFRQKIILGWEAEKNRPNRQPQESFHWEALYERCLDPLPISHEELHAIAMRYALRPEDAQTSYVEDPVCS